MPARVNATDEARRRAEIHIGALVRSLRGARLNACLSHRVVAEALGVSRALVGAWERREITPGVEQLYAWGAVVGLDLSFRDFPAGSPLRDAGQLRLLRRFRRSIGDGWTWRTEVPVAADPRDRRAFDAVISAGSGSVAVEAVARLVDAQGQVRPIRLKREAAGDRIDRLVLVLAGTRHNRATLAAGAPTLDPAFPCPAREALAALRTGRLPPTDAVVLV